MWIWRRMEKVSRVDKNTNKMFLHNTRSKKILDAIRKRKQKWLGHVLRHSGMLRDVLEERILGRTRGNRRIQIVHDLTGNSIDLEKAAEDRNIW